MFEINLHENWESMRDNHST